MDKAIFDKNHIYFDERSRTQAEAFQAIAQKAFDLGYVKDKDSYYEGLWEREQEATTGFQDGIAIPHSKNPTCIKPGVFLIKFKHPIEWNALDGKPVRTALGLTIPEEGGEVHLRILSKLARKMIDENFRTTLNESDDLNELYNIVSAVEI